MKKINRKQLNREYLFRGKPTEEFKDFLQLRKEFCKDGFVYGSLVVQRDRCFICVHAFCAANSFINNGYTTMCEVIPETVGQFTGLYDKTKWDDLSETEKQEFYIKTRCRDIKEVIKLWKGKQIFEGDICTFTDFHSGCDMEQYCEGVFEYEDCQFYITDRLSADTTDLICEGKFDGYIIGNIHNHPYCWRAKT